MNHKVKNMFIDAVFPLFFWGAVYLIPVAVGFWSYEAYLKWYAVMLLFTPLNAVSGRIINRWRTIWKYDYRGYQ